MEKVQYKTTDTDEDGVTETKILTFYFEEEIKDQVPKKNVLDESWQLVEDDVEKEMLQVDSKEQQHMSMKRNFFNSPVPTASKLSMNSSKLPKLQLAAKSA